jgi:hypothetical protein
MAGTLAEVVEGQLKDLFESFKREFALLRLGPSQSDQSAKFVKYLKGIGYLNLGEMIFEIDNGLQSSEPLSREFRTWLGRQAPLLIGRWGRLKAWRLNDLRKQASHTGGSISAEEAKEMYSLSVELISAIPLKLANVE